MGEDGGEDEAVAAHDGRPGLAAVEGDVAEGARPQAVPGEGQQLAVRVPEDGRVGGG